MELASPTYYSTSDTVDMAIYELLFKDTNIMDVLENLVNFNNAW
jgi:hypothetical protein